MTCRAEKAWLSGIWVRAGTGALIAAAAAVAAPTSASGQGFGLADHSACAAGRGGASAASPCSDGSAAFFNPAGITHHDDLTLTLGGTGLFNSGGFEFDGGLPVELDDDPRAFPHVYAAFPIAGRLYGGLGIYVPYSLETRWPLDFSGRFVGYDNLLRSSYAQPSLALRITDWLSVGAGWTVVLSDLEINRRLDLAAEEVPDGLGVAPGTTFGSVGVPAGTDFADATLDSDDNFATGGSFGIRVDPHPRVTVGGRYLTEVETDLEGFLGFSPVQTDMEVAEGNAFGAPAGASLDSLLTASGVFVTGGPFSGQEFSTSVTLPAQALVGIAVRVMDRLRVMADYQWTGWSSLDRLDVSLSVEETPSQDVELGYGNTNGFRLGAEYELPEVTLRAGYAYNEGASPDAAVSPLFPEAGRKHLTAGLGWSSGGLVTVDAAYRYLVQDDRRGRSSRVPSGGFLNDGVFDLESHVVSATVSLRFR